MNDIEMGIMRKRVITSNEQAGGTVVSKTSSYAIPMGERAQMRVGNSVVAVSIVLVTPPMAREWLEREHERNRRTPSVTARYAAEMAAGGWRPSPQPIVFSDSGILIDGGNRLRAVIDSGQPTVFTVWWDWPEDAFACLDRNAPRSLYQADSMTGEAMSRTIYQMGRIMVLLDENRTTVADTEVRDHGRALVVPWTKIGPSLTALHLGRKGLRAPASLAFCIAWLSDPQCVESFITELKGACEHTALPSGPVKNFIRWYENTGAAGAYAARETAQGTAAALRQAATGAVASYTKATPEAWTFWRERPQVRAALEASGA